MSIVAGPQAQIFTPPPAAGKGRRLVFEPGGTLRFGYDPYDAANKAMSPRKVLVLSWLGVAFAAMIAVGEITKRAEREADAKMGEVRARLFSLSLDRCAERDAVLNRFLGTIGVDDKLYKDRLQAFIRNEQERRQNLECRTGPRPVQFGQRDQRKSRLSEEQGEKLGTAAGLLAAVGILVWAMLDHHDRQSARIQDRITQVEEALARWPSAQCAERLNFLFSSFEHNTHNDGQFNNAIRRMWAKEKTSQRKALCQTEPAIQELPPEIHTNP